MLYFLFNILHLKFLSDISYIEQKIKNGILEFIHSLCQNFGIIFICPCLIAGGIDQKCG